MKNKILLVSLVLSLLVFMCVSVNADVGPIGPEFRVNTYTTGNQEYPSVAMDSIGNFVVT